jgi:uncharacterized protein
MSVDGRLRHSRRAGRMTAAATAGDYANMIAGALRLHEATGNEPYLAAALDWAAVLDRHYWVEDGGGYATTADDTADVIVAMRTAADDAVPNANAMMLTNLMQLFLLTGDIGFVDRAEALDRAFAGEVRAAMTQHTGFLANSIDLIAPQMALNDAVSKTGLPGALVYRVSQELDGYVPGLEGKVAVDGRAAAYLCIGPQCAAPITDSAALSTKLRELRRAVSVS